MINEPHDGAPERYGDYVIDVRRRSLYRGSQHIPLAPKSFDVLAYLAAHRERVVTKEELLATLWRREHGVGALRQEMFSLRQALRRSGAAMLVATVAKHGYRFVIPERAGPPLEAAQTFEAPVHDRLSAAARLYAGSSVERYANALTIYESIVDDEPRALAARIGAMRSLVMLAYQSLMPPQEARQRIAAHASAAAGISRGEVQSATLAALGDGITAEGADRSRATLVGLRAAVPTVGLVHCALGLDALLRRQWDDARQYALTALNLDPHDSASRMLLAKIYVHQHCYAQAIDTLDVLASADPQTNEFAIRRAELRILDGTIDEGTIATLRRHLSDARTLSSLGVALARTGRAAEACAILHELDTVRQRRFVSGYFVAKVQTALGMHRAALASLLEADAEPLLALLASDPWFISLSSDVEFKRLVRRNAR